MTCTYETSVAFAPNPARILLASPTQRPRHSTQLRPKSSVLYDSEDRSGSLCESDAQTAHTLQALQTLCTKAVLLFQETAPWTSTQRPKTDMGFAQKGFLRRKKNYFNGHGSCPIKIGGRGGEKGVKSRMMWKTHKTHQQSYGHGCCSEADQQF